MLKEALPSAEKRPTRYQLSQIFRVLNQKEKIIISVLTVLVIFSSILLVHAYYLDATLKQPAIGGEYREGIVGFPQYLNPVLAPSNDADRDLTRIIYSSLFKQDRDNNLVGDLADRYEIKNAGKTIDVWLKDNVSWHDGEKLTAEDVVFTIKTIQDPAFRSPLRPNLSGVTVEKITDNHLRFNLKSYYAPFLQNLSFGILPKHLWQNVSASQFPLHELNIKPVGSGPFVFDEIKKSKEGEIQSITLKSFKKYFDGEPYLKELKFNFYTSRQDLLQDLSKGIVEGVGFVPLSLLDTISKQSSLALHSISLPRYFAVFLNQNQSTALADKNVRLALNYATNKQEIVEKALKGQGEIAEGPILPGMLGYQKKEAFYKYDPQKAKEILALGGWQPKEDGILKKGEDTLAIGLVTLDWPEFKETAQLLKSQWEAIGVKVDLKFEDTASLQQTIIRPRQFQALLFGEVLAKEPDPFAFWHSSQKTDPGLNIALYDNPEVNKILSRARQEPDDQKRALEYQQFQETLLKDAPAVFLYTQNYLFATKKQIKGIDVSSANTPSERFNFVHRWYIKTKRVWK